MIIHYGPVLFQDLSCSPLFENVFPYKSIFHSFPLLHMALSVPFNIQIFLTECTSLACSFLQIILLSYGPLLLFGHLFASLYTYIFPLPLFIYIYKRYIKIHVHPFNRCKIYFYFVIGIYFTCFVKVFWFSFFLSSFITSI